LVERETVHPQERGRVRRSPAFEIAKRYRHPLSLRKRADDGLQIYGLVGQQRSLCISLVLANEDLALMPAGVIDHQSKRNGLQPRP
jgi:hypothetical protein